MTSAAEYVELTERATGPLPHPATFEYIWGDALSELERRSPDVRLINLETSITTSENYWPRKPVLYKMHPANIGCLTVAGIDCCSLANNHVLDWGYSGLAETLKTLNNAGIRQAGAGRNLREAQAPALIEVANDRRVLAVSAGSPSSGVPASWAAGEDRAGVFYFDESSLTEAQAVACAFLTEKGSRDIMVASLHWGGNWGYAVPAEQRAFAHALIDAGIDIVHGHSSHHVKGIEVYHRKLILYGCGDFLNDYEGIGGYENYHPNLTLMYFPTLDETTGILLELRMAPMQIRHFRLNYAGRENAAWLCDTLTHEGQSLGTGARLNDDNTLMLTW